MDSLKFRQKCFKEIKKYYKEELDLILTDKDIYSVWECKILQNNKGLFSTNISDTRYFEITFNGDKNEFYFDSYVIEKNFKCN